MRSCGNYAAGSRTPSSQFPDRTSPTSRCAERRCESATAQPASPSKRLRSKTNLAERAAQFGECVEQGLRRIGRRFAGDMPVDPGLDVAGGGHRIAIEQPNDL